MIEQKLCHEGSRNRSNVTKALGFFSTAYKDADLRARSMAVRHRATRGPRPAPATHMTLEGEMLDILRHSHQKFIDSHSIRFRLVHECSVYRLLKK
jgi:hypothetical protein